MSQIQLFQLIEQLGEIEGIVLEYETGGQVVGIAGEVVQIDFYGKIANIVFEGGRSVEYASSDLTLICGPSREQTPEQSRRKDSRPSRRERTVTPSDAEL